MPKTNGYKAVRFIFKNHRLVFMWLFILMTSCSSPESELTAIKQHRLIEEFVIAADLSHDGALSVIVTDSLSIHVWDNNTLESIATWDANLLDVAPLFVDISADKKQLLVSGENQVVLLDIKQNSEIGRWPIRGVVSDYKITAARYFQEIGMFALGMNDGAVVIADLNAGVFKKAAIHASTVTHLTLDESEQYLLSGGHDGLVAKLLRDDLSVINTQEFDHRISSLVVDERTNKAFISDTLDSQVVIDIYTFNELSSLSYSKRWRWFKDALFVKNGQFLITSSPKTGVFMWDANKGKQVAFWDAKVYSLASQVMAMAINNDGQLITLTNDAVIETWQYSEGY